MHGSQEIAQYMHGAIFVSGEKMDVNLLLPRPSLGRYGSVCHSLCCKSSGRHRPPRTALYPDDDENRSRNSWAKIAAIDRVDVTPARSPAPIPEAFAEAWILWQCDGERVTLHHENKHRTYGVAVKSNQLHFEKPQERQVAQPSWNMRDCPPQRGQDTRRSPSFSTMAKRPSVP